MRNLIPAGARAVLGPALACSLICGGAVVLLAALGLRAAADTGANAGAGAAAAAADPGAPALRPPAAVVVTSPSPPPVTTAPTAAVWTVPFRG